MDIPTISRRVLIPLLGAFLLSACGTGPSSVGGDGARGAEARAAYTVDVDADCGAPPADLAGLFDEIALRHATLAKEGPTLTTNDSAEGIRLKVCRDGLVAAHAGENQVVLHEGLARTLIEGASIVTATPEGYERNHLLDELVRRQPMPMIPTGSTYDLAGSSVAFVVYHELGHIMLGHPPLPFEPERTRTTENEADLYATDLLDATGYRPDGADLVFAILDRVNPDGGATHPSSRERSLRVSLARSAR